MEAGKPYGIAAIAPSTIRSIEGSLLSYLSDIRRSDNPFVLGIDRLVDLDRPDDFISKKALEKIKAEGVKRRLVGIEMHGEALMKSNAEFWPVSNGELEIGRVTRCVNSPRLEKNIGFANVPVEHAAIGSEFVVVTPSGTKQATVCEAPWFPAQKTIPEGI